MSPDPGTAPQPDLSAELRDVTFLDCDLSDAEFSNAQLTRVSFRRCRFDRIQGVGGLRGATVGPAELAELAGPLAAAAGIAVSES